MGSIGGKVKKKIEKKPKFNKHTGFNYHTGWIFFPKTINARYQISMTRLDFGPKTISAHCAFIRECRVQGQTSQAVIYDFAFFQSKFKLYGRVGHVLTCGLRWLRLFDFLSLAHVGTSYLLIFTIRF